MYPTLELVGWHVDLYLVTIAVAVVIGNRLGLWMGEHLEGIPRSKMWFMLGSLAVISFAGARAQFVWNTWGSGLYLRQPLALLRVWDGLHAGGGLVLAVLAAPLIARWQRVSLSSFADAVAPTIPISLAIVRVGCFLHGCCFGTTSDLPWAVRFPTGSPASNFHLSSGVLVAGEPLSAPVHPLQLYFAASGIAAALAGYWIRGRRGYPGRVALVTAAVFCALNALLEGLRAPFYPTLYFWGARIQFEWIAIVLAIVSLCALATGEIRQQLAASFTDKGRLENARL